MTKSVTTLITDAPLQMHALVSVPTVQNTINQAHFPLLQYNRSFSFQNLSSSEPITASPPATGRNSTKTHNKSQNIKKHEKAAGSIPPRPESHFYLSENGYPPLEIKPPNPTIALDSNRQQIAIRCVCLGDVKDNKTLLKVKCSICGFYVHGLCVGIARVLPKKTTNFICPFCLGHPIRCSCEQKYKYDEPLIQCEKCHYWVHKKCANLSFGPNPSSFICFNCQPNKKTANYYYRLPNVYFSENSLCLNDEDILIDDIEKIELLSKLPQGEFRTNIEQDLEKSSLNFRQMLTKYVDLFLPNLFDYSHEFWRTFVVTLSELMKVQKKDVLDAIDELTINILYHRSIPKKHKAIIPKLEISDSIFASVRSEPLQKVDSFPDLQRTDPLIYVTKNFTVCAEKNIENNEFICEVTGLLCHEDEIDASKGIPRTCINFPEYETKIFIDVSRSSNQVIQYIRRSFNFNCIIKMVRIDDKIRVGLYAIKMKGTFVDDKGSSKTVAIPEGGELFLPMDADLPFPVEKLVWKEKKIKPKPPTKVKKPKREEKPKKKAPNSKSTDNIDSIDNDNDNSNGNDNDTKIEIHKENGELVKSNQRIKTRRTSTIETRAMRTKTKKEFPFQLTLLTSFLEDACPPLPISLKNPIEAINEDNSKTSARMTTRHMSHVRHLSSPSEPSD